jgi:dTDP-4-amino-4,6-dideoxygalactose transaminase
VGAVHGGPADCTTGAHALSRHFLSYADWSVDEYASIFRSLISARVIAGDNPAKLANALAENYDLSAIYPMNSGRGAIHIALSTFRKQNPDRTEVIVPAYICPSVVETVAASGLKAVPADVGDDLNVNPATIAAALTDRTLVVIAAHMYGCPARIGEIEKFCREAGVFLIDDAAQVVGVHQEQRMLGSFGDMGVISFAQSKAIVTGVRGSGAALLVNNPEMNAEARAAWETLPLPSRRLVAIADFLWNYVWAPYTGDSGYYLARIGDYFGNYFGLRLNVPAVRAHISNLEAGIALVQLKRLARMQRDRIRIAEAYHQELRHCRDIGFPQYAPGRYLSRVMLSLPEEVDLPAVRDALQKARLETRLGYDAALLRGAATAKATSLSKRLLGVPCGAGMPEIEVQQICRTVRTVLNCRSVFRKSE